jgi:DNA-binding transcriptional regulator GbsR (MarR family)
LHQTWRTISIIAFVSISLLFLEQSKFIFGTTTSSNFFQGDVPINHLCVESDFLEIENFSIGVDNPELWSLNYESIPTQESQLIPYLPDDFKEYFSGILSLNLKNKTCKFPIQIRLRGNSQGHQQGVFRSSLSIKMSEGNLGGVTEFRLFLPESRLSEGEIFATSYLKKLGFLVPRTKFVNVSFEGNTNRYILQEKIAKEMILASNLPDGYLIEGNEKSLSDELEFASPVIFKTLGRLIKSETLEFSNETVEFGQKMLNYLNNKFLDHYQQSDPRLLQIKELIDKTSLMENKYFNAFSLAIRAEHGLAIHNRNFYVNPFSKRISPIYYDGMSQVFEPVTEIEYSRIVVENGFTGANYKKADWKFLLDSHLQINKRNLQKDMCSRGLCLSRATVSKTMNMISDNLNFLSRVHNQKIVGLKRDYFDTDKFTPGFLGFLNKRIITICDPNLRNCRTLNKPLTKKQVISYLVGEMEYKNQLVRPITSLITSYKQTKNRVQEPTAWQSDFDTDLQLGMSITGNLKVFRTPGSRKILIVAKDRAGRVFFDRSTLIDYEITFVGASKRVIDSPSNIVLPNSACLTFYGANLVRSKISVLNCKLGDAVNFVKSYSVNSQFDISGAFQDALDSDFSTFLRSEINIVGAGNNCTDFSFSNAQEVKIDVAQCLHNGVRAGEKSTIDILNLEVKSSKHGVLSMDSSFVTVSKSKIESDICYLAFRSKQEFTGSKLIVRYKGIDNCRISEIFKKSRSSVVFNVLS